MSKVGFIDGKMRQVDGLWDDMRVPAQEVVNIPGPLEPQWMQLLDDGFGSEGVWALHFDIGHQSFFNIQFPHDWKVGTDIYPHVHWTTDASAGPGDVVWGLEYTVTPVFAPFPLTSVLLTLPPGLVSGPYIHEVTGFGPPSIDGSLLGLSSMLLCRIWRDVGTYPGLIALLEIDFHYLKDDLGSVSQYSKE